MEGSEPLTVPELCLGALLSLLVLLPMVRPCCRWCRRSQDEWVPGLWEVADPTPQQRLHRVGGAVVVGAVVAVLVSWRGVVLLLVGFCGWALVSWLCWVVTAPPTGQWRRGTQ